MVRRASQIVSLLGLMFAVTLLAGGGLTVTGEIEASAVSRPLSESQAEVGSLVCAGCHANHATLVEQTPHGAPDIGSGCETDAGEGCATAEAVTGREERTHGQWRRQQLLSPLHWDVR